MTKSLPGTALPPGAHGGASRARLLLVDDHAFVREVVKVIVGRDASLEVVGEARDGEEAIKRCRELRPDLILMDVSMPKMDGLEATRRIKSQSPSTSVLILTSHTDHGLLMDAVKAGAAGYILKGDDPDHVLDSVRAVLGGKTPLDQGLAMTLLRHLGEEAAAAQQGAGPPAQQDTRRPLAAVPNSLTPRVEVKSEQGKGTAVIAEVPLPALGQTEDAHDPK